MKKVGWWIVAAVLYVIVVNVVDYLVLYGG